MSEKLGRARGCLWLCHAPASWQSIRTCAAEEPERSAASSDLSAARNREGWSARCAWKEATRTATAAPASTAPQGLSSDAKNGESQNRPQAAYARLSGDCISVRSTLHTVGGGFCSVIINTFMGGYLAKGAWPCASSRSVIPRDLRVPAFSSNDAQGMQPQLLHTRCQPAGRIHWTAP